MLNLHQLQWVKVKRAFEINLPITRNSCSPPFITKNPDGKVSQAKGATGDPLGFSHLKKMDFWTRWQYLYNIKATGVLLVAKLTDF